MENKKLNSCLERLTEILRYLRDQVSKLINFCTNEQRRSNTNQTDIIYKVSGDSSKNDDDLAKLDDPENQKKFDNARLVIKSSEDTKRKNTCTIL